MTRMLTGLGYEIVGPVADGQQAIDICRSEAPDLALLDIQMPNINGIEAAREIHEQLQVPVIIVSAYSDPEYVDLGRRAGVFGYLLKPVTKDQLRVTISVAWERYRDHAAGRSEIASLNRRLEQRKVVEQAKWVLVSRRGISEPDAMRALQRHARNKRQPLVDVANAVINGQSLNDVD